MPRSRSCCGRPRAKSSAVLRRCAAPGAHRWRASVRAALSDHRRARRRAEQRARDAVPARWQTRSTIVLSAPPMQGIQVQILRDETDLEAARRARDSVLGNISHEFRTPLAAQLASIELLREGLGNMRPEAQRELLANVERGVLRLMRPDRQSARERAHRGRSTLDPPAAGGSGGSGHRGAGPDRTAAAAAATAGRDRCPGHRRAGARRRPAPRQVFVNLLANAAKFSPEGSTIRIGGRPVRRTDRGMGRGRGSRGASAAVPRRFSSASSAAPKPSPKPRVWDWAVDRQIDRRATRRLGAGGAYRCAAHALYAGTAAGNGELKT